jgi:hypothetical protein
VFLATRGQCDLDDGPRPLEDLALFTQLLRQARSIFARSLGWGLLLTLAGLLLPVGTP